MLAREFETRSLFTRSYKTWRILERGHLARIEMFSVIPELMREQVRWHMERGHLARIEMFSDVPELTASKFGGIWSAGGSPASECAGTDYILARC
jgi:hypothetical protein